GLPRFGAVAFVIGGKGYVGMGSDNNNNALKDFYAYDPTTGAWSQTGEVADINQGRYKAMAFSIGGKGYVVGGTTVVGDQTLGKDSVDEYNPGTNQWTHR